MNVGMLGGTFDPIHQGHLGFARAARARFQLERIYFVPAHVPPHKQGQRLAAYFHRYAMVALATAGEAAFVPSLLEAPRLAPFPSSSVHADVAPSHGPEIANYTIDTVRRLRRALGEGDRIFLLVGIDAFREIASWHEAEALLREVELVVASRPGYSLEGISYPLSQLYPSSSVSAAALSYREAQASFAAKGMAVHCLENLQHDISATLIRSSGDSLGNLEKLVTPSVAEYIHKMELYRER